MLKDHFPKSVQYFLSPYEALFNILLFVLIFSLHKLYLRFTILETWLYVKRKLEFSKKKRQLFRGLLKKLSF